MGELEKEKRRYESLIESSIWAIRNDLEDLERDFEEYQNLKKENNSKYIEVNKLITKMKNDGIYTPELEDFFDPYLKFDNN